MRIEQFTADRNSEVRIFVLNVLAEEGFEYDSTRDFDLDDIHEYYISKGGMFFIGTIDGEIMGTSAVRRTDDQTCEIRRIYVKRDLRGRGYGRDLFLHALGYSRYKCRTISLKTDRSLVTAIRMYQKYGFTRVKKDGDTLFFLYDK